MRVCERYRVVRRNSGKAGSSFFFRGLSWYYYIIAIIIFIVFCCSIKSSIALHEEHQGIFRGCVTCVCFIFGAYIFLVYIHNLYLYKCSFLDETGYESVPLCERYLITCRQPPMRAWSLSHGVTTALVT